METIGARRRRGVIIGKFLPPHRGHLHLIEAARRRVEHLTVLVCTLEREPIPGALRHAWLSELCPGVEVRHVTDENPQEPHEHPDFWKIWSATIRNHAGAELDVLFSSEAYGDRLAASLGIRHEPIDLERRAVPVSGTAIRARPLAHWADIPAVVRPWFAKRVVLTGSESTGKTTLAAELAQRFATVWTPEYGRLYFDERRRPFMPEDIEPIAAGQMALEDEARGRANRIVIQDTDLVSTVVYARRYHGACPAVVEAACRARRADLYVLLDIDVAWVPDPQRDLGGEREAVQAAFRAELAALGASVVEVAGAFAERSARAAAAIEERLAAW